MEDIKESILSKILQSQDEIVIQALNVCREAIQIYE